MPASILVIVQPCPYVVEIVELSLDLVHSCTGELHQGEEEGHVIGNSEENAFLVLQVFGVDLMDQLCSVGTQMAEFHRTATVKVVVFLSISVL